MLCWFQILLHLHTEPGCLQNRRMPQQVPWEHALERWAWLGMWDTTNIDPAYCSPSRTRWWSSGSTWHPWSVPGNGWRWVMYNEHTAACGIQAVMLVWEVRAIVGPWKTLDGDGASGGVDWAETPRWAHSASTDLGLRGEGIVSACRWNLGYWWDRHMQRDKPSMLHCQATPAQPEWDCCKSLQNTARGLSCQ